MGMAGEPAGRAGRQGRGANGHPSVRAAKLPLAHPRCSAFASRPRGRPRASVRLKRVRAGSRGGHAAGSRCPDTLQSPRGRQQAADAQIPYSGHAAGRPCLHAYGHATYLPRASAQPMLVTCQHAHAAPSREPRRAPRGSLCRGRMGRVAHTRELLASDTRRYRSPSPRASRAGGHARCKTAGASCMPCKTAGVSCMPWAGKRPTRGRKEQQGRTRGRGQVSRAVRGAVRVPRTGPYACPSKQRGTRTGP